MSEAIETIEYKGYTIEVHPDSDAEMPREGRMGTLVIDAPIGAFDENFKDTYNGSSEAFWSTLSGIDLGNYQFREESSDPDGVISWRTDYLYGNRWLSDSEMVDQMVIKTREKYCILPVFKFDHSEVAYNTTGFSCAWDSGQVGYIYVEWAEAKKEFGWANLSKLRCEKVCKALEDEVDLYSQWANGEVYGYLLCDPKGDPIDTLFGIYGGYGDDSYLMAEAKRQVDYYLEDK